METHVLITFTNFTLTSNESNSPLQMELAYESKKIKFNYPQTEPLKLNLSSKFIQDKISLVLSISVDSGHSKKSKIQFRGDITLNKTIFADNNKTIYEKNITMIPTEPIKEMKDMKDMKKIGKIFMQIQLLDQIEEWKKNMKNLNKKKTGTKLKNTNISNNDSTSNNKNNSVNNNINNNNSNEKTSNKQLSYKKSKKSGDILSDVTIEPINDDEIEDNKAINELNKLISVDHINQLKEILKKDYKKIFPNDINALKTLNENLYQKYNQLSIKYNEILQGLNNANENIRKKAVEYFNEYKDLKTKLEQKKSEYVKKQKNIDNEISKNQQENENIKNNLQNYYNEKDFFFKKLSAPPKQEEKKNTPQKANNNEPNISQLTNNTDIKMLRDGLKKISSLGYDLLDGLNITEEEKKLLNSLLGDLDNKNNTEKKNENDAKNIEDVNDKDAGKEADKEDFDLSNQIVGLIERDVNDLYMRKLIEQVKIDQIDAITYSFQGNTKTKEVEFKIENGNLICNTGESFTVWLISNFSL